MNISLTEIIMLVFTGVIAGSTVMYTIFSRKLWKATRSSVDIARYTGFLNLMVMLNNSIEDAKRKGLPEAIMLQQLGNIMGEFGFKRFLDDIDFDKDKEDREYFEKFEELFRNNNIDPNSISWFRPILKKLKKN